MEDAVRHRHAGVQELLRKCGARLEMSGKDYAGKLCDAAAAGDLETIQVLAQNGVDMSSDDYDGRTALHLAAANEKVAVLEFLLNFEPPINVNPLDRFEDTPLGDALRHARPTATSMLRQAGGKEKAAAAKSLSEGGSLHDPSVLRKKALREPAVQEMMAASMEKHALQWVIEKLEPTMNDKVFHAPSIAHTLSVHSRSFRVLTSCVEGQTEGMLEVIECLRCALDELANDYAGPPASSCSPPLHSARLSRCPHGAHLNRAALHTRHRICPALTWLS